MAQQALREHFFEKLISGDRAAVREMIDGCFRGKATAEQVIERLIWPTLEMVEQMHREDQLAMLSHHYATRLLRMLVDQLQLKYKMKPSRGERVLVFSGPNEDCDLQGQISADLLEAQGFEVFFAGGGVANDEVIDQIGLMKPSRLVLFGATAKDLPYIRQLIDRLSDMEMTEDLQVVVGGGVFNRAEGLAAEIGADLWDVDPLGLVKRVVEEADRRAGADQRTVGRRRRNAA